MARLRGRLKTYWFAWRFDALVLEGFTPEEAALIANCRISSGPIRRIRRQRKRMVQRAVDAGLERREAVEYVRLRIRDTDAEMLTWEDLRRILYPEKQRIFG